MKPLLHSLSPFCQRLVHMPSYKACVRRSGTPQGLQAELCLTLCRGLRVLRLDDSCLSE